MVWFCFSVDTLNRQGQEKWICLFLFFKISCVYLFVCQHSLRFLTGNRGYCWRLVIQLCLPFCNPMDCSSPGSSAHVISQARILEWVVVSFSRGSSQPRDWTLVSCIGRWILYHWAMWGSSMRLYSLLFILPKNIYENKKLVALWFLVFGVLSIYLQFCVISF